MKKVLLIPTILAIASAPTISLVGCGNGGDEPTTKSVDFGISSRQTTSKTTATLSLDWQPSEDSITFSSLSATSASNKIVSYEFEGQSRPQQINLRFENELTVDVDDIILEFDYHDKTQKIIDHAVLNNIPVLAPTPLPTIIATGVARPNAHGQLITRTDMPLARE